MSDDNQDAKPSLISRIASELGFYSILASTRDTKLLCASRFVRHFAYGASTLILAIYLSKLGISETRIGLFMTMTLLGDVVISFLLTLMADRLGRRRVLLAGSALMTASGLVFMWSGNYWILVLASILGVISPSGNEIGPFRAIEESTLAQLSSPSIRSDIFAWLTLLGKAGAGCGTIICGWLVEALMGHDRQTELRAYRIIFGIYAGLGVVKMLITLLLSSACEHESLQKEGRQASAPGERASVVEGETQRLLPHSDEHEAAESPEAVNSQASKHPSSPAEPNYGSAGNQPKKSKTKPFWPSISGESKKTMTKLCLLFAIDSFASGLVPLSWLTYFYNKRYHIDDGQLGTLFFVSSLVGAVSNLFAASLAKRIGLIKTMVFTHLPSAIALTLMPVPPPNQAWLSILLLIVRASISNMDQAPRQAFISTAVLPQERTAVMGFVNVVKTLSQSGGPVVTGFLATAGKFWVAFVVAGTLKIGYDLGLLGLFLRYRSREEKEEERRKQDRSAET